MPRIQHVLFVGIYNSVVALDTRDGAELWRTKLGGMSFVNVFWDGEELFAATKGEAFRLDVKTGQVVWHNKMKGLGTGFVTFASTRPPRVDAQLGATTAAVAATRQREAAAAGAS